ncbi:MAG: acyl-CoA dehydrogenase family protein [Candidatus Hydrogenedentota bacterium]
MDFNDTAEEATFRAEVVAWLGEHASVFGQADRRRHTINEDYREDLKRAKGWQAKKGDAGYACILWPKEYGGMGGTPMQAAIFREEESKYAVPRGFFEIGIGMAGPTMMMYATQEQNEKYLPKMMSGEEAWCQLFSEPSAGSDLAGLKTRAIQDEEGGDWVVNGTKVWTSGAHFCDYGIFVARHDPTLPKHRGLTYFFIDMKSPGIRIERIKQMSGGSSFCEVFFEDVRIPDAQRLGGVGDGWGVALTTLMNERLAVGDAPPPDASDLLALAQSMTIDGAPALENAAVREKLADWFVESRGLKFTKLRTMTALSRGQTPGPEASIAKLVGASKLQDIGSFGMDLADMGGIMTDPSVMPYDAAFQNGFIYAPGFRIAGGTDEILRNIIAERVLGLPPDIRVDKEKPFSQLPTGAN